MSAPKTTQTTSGRCDTRKTPKRIWSGARAIARSPYLQKRGCHGRASLGFAGKHLPGPRGGGVGVVLPVEPRFVPAWVDQRSRGRTKSGSRGSVNSIDRRCLDGSAWLRWKHAVGHGSMLVFVGSFRGITARVGNHAHSGTDTYKSWLFVGLCRTATSSVPLLGACAFSAFFAAFAAAFAALGVITCDSSSLPLEVVLTSDTATVLRGTVLPRELGLAPSVTPSPASMPVSSERSEEFSAAGAGAKARRVGLASSISRSCLIVRRVRHGGMGIVSVARRITEAYPRPSSQSESLIESAGRQTLRFLLTTAVPYLARGRATFAAPGDGSHGCWPLGAHRSVGVFDVSHLASYHVWGREDEVNSGTTEIRLS